MANEYTENLKKGEKTQFKSGKDASEKGRKGGRKSQQVQKEKRTIQKILNDFCNGQLKDNPRFADIAASFGIESDKSVKELITYLAMLNAVYKADLDKLGKLTELLGEKTESISETEEKQTNLLGAIEKAVKNAD